MRWVHKHSIILGVLLGCGIVLTSGDYLLGNISLIDGFQRWWCLSFMAGVLLGHLIAPKVTGLLGPLRLSVVVGTAVAALLLNVASLFTFGGHTLAPPLSFAIGFVFGHLTWPHYTE